ncbi:alkaline phosphatase family protein [Halobium salinum]|uniref:Alkaline phosphatase family protein n=1 Tax=Halobium salinum TaxID=1364940 RepID=A0ABD5P637_9EURY|nr:alkaline phosphatase family protein [Halobium salinum]
MTLVILALDALDAGLVEHFDLDSFRLASSTEVQTFAHARDQPFTPEVWATVATGLDPEEHGVTGSGTSEWDNPLLEFASKFSAKLPENRRGQLGDLVGRATGERERVGRTDRKTVFDREGGVVRNWPGVGDGADLQRAWDLMVAVSKDISRREFERDLLGLCAEQFGWAREMLHHEVSVAGVHVHTLDAAGHAYADDEAALREVYERVGGFVDEVAAALGPDDDLLLLSDHGMRTAFFDADAGEKPGSHSWRAYASATTEDVPDDVYDVADWVDRHVRGVAPDEDDRVEMPMEQLRDLGYVE